MRFARRIYGALVSVGTVMSDIAVRAAQNADLGVQGAQALADTRDMREELWRGVTLNALLRPR